MNPLVQWNGLKALYIWSVQWKHLARAVISNNSYTGVIFTVQFQYIYTFNF